MKRIQDTKYLFEPRSIAVIGATPNPSKLGHVVIDNVISGGYKGRIYPVNPKGEAVAGLPAVKSIRDADGVVDLAVIVIPANAVYNAVKDCADHGVKFAAIITSGFSEIGNIAEERKIVNYAVEHDMRVLGPNIVGIYSTSINLNATFVRGRFGKKGHVALLSQSGALASAIAGKAAMANIGLSTVISLGNKADLNEADLLDYLVDSEQTKVIMMYMEGVTKGEQLIDSLKRVTRVKPMVVLKSGRSKRGAMAAASHTGSLAGEDAVFDDIAKQCGLIRASELSQALEWCKFLSGTPKPQGENTVIITNGGGIGVMATDACEQYDINLYDNLTDLKNTFSQTTPDFGSLKNPVDLTGQATMDHYTGAIDAALANNNIHAVLCLGVESGVFNAAEFMSRMVEYYKAGVFKKPVIFCFVGGRIIEESVIRLKTTGMPIFLEVMDGVSCLGAIYRHYKNTALIENQPEFASIDDEAIKSILDKARKDNRRFLLAHEGQALLHAIGVKGPKSSIARNLDEAVKLAEDTGYPIVMKVVSRDIVHKSDAGGVALDILNKHEVSDAYEAIMQHCRRYKPDAVIEGIEVAEQVRSGVETIVGARRDKSFGPIVMFGLGGIYVEVMKDISFRAFPLARDEINKMISQIKTYPLLLGVRGEKRKDTEAISDAILQVGTVLKKFPDISDIEINPLVAYDYGEGVTAVDVRILLSR